VATRRVHVSLEKTTENVRGVGVWACGAGAGACPGGCSR